MFVRQGPDAIECLTNELKQHFTELVAACTRHSVTVVLWCPSGALRIDPEVEQLRCGPDQWFTLFVVGAGTSIAREMPGIDWGPVKN